MGATSFQIIASALKCQYSIYECKMFLKTCHCSLHYVPNHVDIVNSFGHPLIIIIFITLQLGGYPVAVVYTVNLNTF
jgi:hypothetical protein